MNISLKQIQHLGPWYLKRGWLLAISSVAMLSLLNASPWTCRWNKAYQPLKWNKLTSTCTESSACSPFTLWVLFCQNTFVVPLTLKNSPSQSGVLTLPYDGDLLPPRGLCLSLMLGIEKQSESCTWSVTWSNWFFFNVCLNVCYPSKLYLFKMSVELSSHPCSEFRYFTITSAVMAAYLVLCLT